MLKFPRLLLALVAVLLMGCDAATPTPPPADTAGAAQRVEAAKTALKDKKLDVAITEAEAAVKADPNSPDAQFVLGNAYNQAASVEADNAKRQGYLSNAINAYLAAIKLAPNRDDALTNLGTVYYQTGQFDEAEKQAQAALKIKPNDARTHYLLGTIYLQRDPKKDPTVLDKAQKEFEAAVANETDLGAGYIGLANVFLFKGDYVNAKLQAQKGVDLMKADPDPFALWALAQAQCGGGDKANGSKTTGQILGMNVPDPVFVQQVQALAAQCQ
jgi:tetratricopeptide (TPR) repeat protein